MKINKEVGYSFSVKRHASGTAMMLAMGTMYHGDNHAAISFATNDLKLTREEWDDINAHVKALFDHATGPNAA